MHLLPADVLWSGYAAKAHQVAHWRGATVPVYAVPKVVYTESLFATTHEVFAQRQQATPVRTLSSFILTKTRLRQPRGKAHWRKALSMWPLYQVFCTEAWPNDPHQEAYGRKAVRLQQSWWQWQHHISGLSRFTVLSHARNIPSDHRKAVPMWYITSRLACRTWQKRAAATKPAAATAAAKFFRWNDLSVPARNMLNGVH